MLTLVTLTGDRPVAWALCQQFMANQDYQGPVRWVIVDDGAKAQEITFARDGWTLEVIRPHPFWSEGQNTQSRNLREALKVIGDSDRVVFIEDDDWYATYWLSLIDQQLDLADLVGEKCAFYYNIEHRRYRQLNNHTHSSLCSTAVKGKALANLRAISQFKMDFIDIALWKSSASRRLFRGSSVIGIKGMPGRNGIGMGHRPPKEFQPDSSGEVLRSKVGSNADLYLNLTF